MEPSATPESASPENYSEYFRDLTGHLPYGFQDDLALRILRGESLVFRAPTGSGKTWATVAPFLYSLQKCPRLADRLIYALPLRSLASSLHSTVLEAMQKLGQVERGAKDREYPRQKLYCSLQMGGEKNDPFFEGDLIFCTIDQVLSGYLMMPLSLPDRLANMVAGALPGSFLILDEAHLLESEVALGTVIEMLDRFRDVTQFVLMTATMSDESIAWLAKKLRANVHDLPESEIRRLPVQSTKERIWQWRGVQLSAEAVTKAHNSGRTLVIVNRVERAQDLFSELKLAYRNSATRIACLHSRFFPEDRQRTELELQPWFGKGASETDVILVTTQVVEAGIDISADHILTELAPMNSLVQRAGRTARYVDRCQGRITVFDVEKSLPYSDSESEITNTRNCLQELDKSGEDIDFQHEQAWIEKVHGVAEKTALASYENIHSRRGIVEDAIRSGDRGLLSGLVRDIDSVNVLLSNAPDSVIFDSNRWPNLLSIPRSSVWKLKDAIQRGVAGIWRAINSEEESSPPSFTWSRVSAEAELKGCWLIALGTDAASYTTEAGLRLGSSGDTLPVRYSDRPPMLRYQYFYETWTDHVRRVMDQARSMAASNATGARKLEESLPLASGAAENLVELSALLHDTGKLSKEWQANAWDYETGQTGRARGEPIAHTTKGPGEKGPRLPNHAVEGAFAAMSLIGHQCPEAALTIARAIARHHSPRAANCSEFDLITGADDLLRQLDGTVSGLQNGSSLLGLREFGTDLNAIWEDRDWWPFYAWLVRRLRLADQAGTATGVREAAAAND